MPKSWYQHTAHSSVNKLPSILWHNSHLMCKGWCISKCICKVWLLRWRLHWRLRLRLRLHCRSHPVCDYLAKCRIKCCWTKLCLFLDVRSKDHRGRSPCTRNWWRDSVPAGETVLSRARFSQLSAQFSVQSKITVFAGKTYRHTVLIAWHLYHLVWWVHQIVLSNFWSSFSEKLREVIHNWEKEKRKGMKKTTTTITKTKQNRGEFDYLERTVNSRLFT